MGSVYSQPSRWLREKQDHQAVEEQALEARKLGAALGGEMAVPGPGWGRGRGTKEGPSERGPSGSLLQEGLGHR